MRNASIFILGALLLAGCRFGDRSSSDADPMPSPGQETTAGRLATRSKNSRPAKIVPLNEVNGRIAAVNPTLRYVVVDFYLSRIPQLDQRMAVYRQGEKVGEIKITGPERNQNIAADILAGEANVGDEVRPE